MKGSETLLLGFMEGANFRYVIPVYQRKYDWKLDNCRQLFEDLKRIIRDDRRSHFFGSLVSMVVPTGATIEYHIIDGQQRLTTITLLLLAMSNLISKGAVHAEDENLDQQILQRFIIAPWAKAGDKIKLRPIKQDSEALEKLIDGDLVDFIKDSNLTINYRFFCDQLLKEEISVDELFAAINKLEIISITLDHDDRPQLIFESLNSTGLALQEGDKIRNYILMGLKPEDQVKYYDGYWTKIELCTGQDLSSFIRDYLSIKEQVTPTIGNVYQAFKRYSEDKNLPISDLLEDILRYARIYEKLKKGKSGLNNYSLDDCLERLNRLEIVVTEPFFMEVFRLNEDGLISVEEIRQILLITENYLFRRNICEVPTNALNKVFLTLNNEIIKYDNTPSDYVNKFIYALLSKRESGRFPRDEEFKEALAAKQVYMMRGKYKAYLFERFENYGTVEVKDVYKLLDAGTYSIEHIMPQHLNPAWKELLGTDAESIHTAWLHRLGNLTLTGYNSKMSNRSFLEKRDGENGYKQSGLRMNQKIALKDVWGENEIQERNAEMVDLAVKTIWPLPSTSYVKQKKEYDSYSLEDSTAVLTGRDITSFVYKNIETPVSSWTDMYEHILKYLHKKDKSVLSSIAYGSSKTELSAYISAVPEKLRSNLKIDEDIFVEKNMSTAMKISTLRKLFNFYKEDPLDLVFNLKDDQKEKNAEETRFELRRRYWTFSLPIIREKNVQWGSFTNRNPGNDNYLSGFVGLRGFTINCIANYDCAKVEFWLGNVDALKNKEAFDYLFSHKNEIEQKLGIEPDWNRADNKKCSSITYTIHNVSIVAEEDWQRMAKFHAEWSAKFCEAMLPFLYEKYNGSSLQNVKDNQCLNNLAEIIKEWAIEKTAEGKMKVVLEKCNRTYIRFQTEEFSVILPPTPEALSGWNTPEHYYYEIINRTGDSFYIALAISSKNMSDAQKKICDQIFKQASLKKKKEDWQWASVIRSGTVKFSKDAGKEEVFMKLDEAFEEIIKKQEMLLKI